MNNIQLILQPFIDNRKFLLPVDRFVEAYLDEWV